MGYFKSENVKTPKGKGIVEKDQINGNKYVVIRLSDTGKLKIYNENKIEYDESYEKLEIISDKVMIDFMKQLAEDARKKEVRI